MLVFQFCHCCLNLVLLLPRTAGVIVILALCAHQSHACTKQSIDIFTNVWGWGKPKAARAKMAKKKTTKRAKRAERATKEVS